MRLQYHYSQIYKVCCQYYIKSRVRGGREGREFLIQLTRTRSLGDSCQSTLKCTWIQFWHSPWRLQFKI